jgi:5S rRNA maturation endonuclease (ribonuclease M5)
MSERNGWQRVRRGRPCPICERADWCLLATDGSAAICARTESAKRCGEAGWLHRLRDDGWRPPRRIVRSVPLTPASRRYDLAELAASYRDAVNPDRLNALARSLGLSAEALTALGIGWSAHYGAWSFQMVDLAGAVLGIRLRRPNGSKFSVSGGKEGLFLPVLPDLTGPRLLICEGPTDTAALLHLGFANVVGRPSCTGGIKLLVELVRLRKPSEVVIVADADEPGRRGADNLASVLVAYVPAVRVLQPPAGIKDARAWLQAGATHRDVQEAIDAAPVRRLTVRAVAAQRSR